MGKEGRGKGDLGETGPGRIVQTVDEFSLI